MIDVNSGAIVFDDNLSIDAHTPLQKMEAMPNTKPAPSIPGRAQLSMGVHSAHGESWGVGVVYVQSTLTQVWLQCLSADGLESPAWNVENEKRRKVVHDAWVYKICSASGKKVEQSAPSLTFKFRWGKVSSVWDPRGVQALILVEYS